MHHNPAIVARRWTAALLATLLGAVPASAGQRGEAERNDPRIERVERWLKATLHHTPGEVDAALDEVSQWPAPFLRTLWVDLSVVADLSRNPKLVRFALKREGNGAPNAKPVEVHYQAQQLRRMRTLACVVSGDMESPVCAPRKDELDPELRQLAMRADGARRAGNDNYVLRRGALLEADAAMIGTPPAPDFVSTEVLPDLGPQRIRVDVSDGQGSNARTEGVHWIVAYAILDRIIPPGGDRIAPARDAMVREWYTATARWAQFTGHYDEAHLTRALHLFPDDADLRFLAGCQNEIDAGPAVQSAAKSVSLPYGITISVESQKNELHGAESQFRQALQARPEWPEAWLRLGRVRAQLGELREAAAILRTALETQRDEVVEYYAALFLGDVEEQGGRFDAAARLYERASLLQGGAQTPRVALSQLAHRRGDRAGALRALQPLFDAAPAEDDPVDPWWDYLIFQARESEEGLRHLYRPFLEGADR